MILVLDEHICDADLHLDPELGVGQVIGASLMWSLHSWYQLA